MHRATDAERNGHKETSWPKDTHRRCCRQNKGETDQLRNTGRERQTGTESGTEILSRVADT